MGIACTLCALKVKTGYNYTTVSNANECYTQFKNITLDTDDVIRVKGVKDHQMPWHPMHMFVKFYDLIPN